MRGVMCSSVKIYYCPTAHNRCRWCNHALRNYMHLWFVRDIWRYTNVFWLQGW